MLPGTSLNWIRISALRSFSALPARMMNGTPSHRSLLILSTHVQNVGVFESSGTPGSSRYPMEDSSTWRWDTEMGAGVTVVRKRSVPSVRHAACTQPSLPRNEDRGRCKQAKSMTEMPVGRTVHGHAPVTMPAMHRCGTPTQVPSTVHTAPRHKLQRNTYPFRWIGNILAKHTILQFQLGNALEHFDFLVADVIGVGGTRLLHRNDG
eukprot:m.721534 g.721534  ORF g.721534 m.721534 type:complete len:207 (-) comp23014_c0_seq5:1122-1742(-)